MIKIGVLTSSRADYGIYEPLLKNLKLDREVALTIIAFGSHLSSFHGNTIEEIKKAGYDRIHTLSSLLLNDEVHSIATAYGLTVLKFAEYWREHFYDVVLCLGDRFEMAAAVQAGIPFGVRFCHLHGGETTLGAIDNIYRHQITLASFLHFTATAAYAQKIANLTGSSENIHYTGALSISALQDISIPDEKSFRQTYSIPDGPYILSTFHPETVAFGKNEYFAEQMYIALSRLAETTVVVITMPNTDTLGTVYRERLNKLKQEHSHSVVLIEHFGKTNYFAAMKYAKMLLGNTSSGIIEAASFKKYVVNVGDRQKGRAQSDNITDVPFEAEQIYESAMHSLKKKTYEGENIYFKTDTITTMISILKKVSI